MTSKNDFDKIIPRRGTASLKWDKYPDADAIAMWVADMDFAAPRAVLDALCEHIDHGVLGYPTVPGELVESVVHHLESRYRWSIDPGWIVWLPGLVSALHLACRSGADPDDEVITFTPIYPPFLTAPPLSGRKLKKVPLICSEGRWCFDLDRLSQTITDRTRLLLLCNPHNPVGRAFSRDELKALADICLAHNVIICSDEIHCDLILDDLNHVPTASLSPEIADRTITLMSPSKTYNLPGVALGFAVIPNRELRQKFIAVKTGIVPDPMALAYTAALAAYRCGEPWRQDLLTYLGQNRDLVEDFIKKTPALSTTHVEATYLAWINTQELQKTVADPAGFFRRNGVIFFDGKPFGDPNYLRLNFACPRSLLTQALARIQKALNNPT